VRVVGLGAICDVNSAEIEDPRTNSFTISEFVLLATGERIVLHAERGFSGWLSAPGNVWSYESIESVTRYFLTAVLPDDGDEEHPWEWLAECARAQGVDVAAGDLRLLPYEVVLTDRVMSRLSAAE
jgi:hypothetical protein